MSGSGCVVGKIAREELLLRYESQRLGSIHLQPWPRECFWQRQPEVAVDVLANDPQAFVGVNDDASMHVLTSSEPHRALPHISIPGALDTGNPLSCLVLGVAVVQHHGPARRQTCKRSYNVPVDLVRLV